MPGAKRRDATIGSALAVILRGFRIEAPEGWPFCSPRTTADVAARCPCGGRAAEYARTPTWPEGAKRV